MVKKFLLFALIALNVSTGSAQRKSKSETEPGGSVFDNEIAAKIIMQRINKVRIENKEDTLLYEEMLTKASVMQAEDMAYEIYGLHGVALLVKVSRQCYRTASDIRSIVTKSGGSIATPGPASRLFQRKGQIIVSRATAGEDQLMELALEAAAEDSKSEPLGYEIITEPAKFEMVHKQVEARNIKCEAPEITSLPTITVPLADTPAAAAVGKLIEALEEHDDVKEVFSNAEFPEP